jgi:hypothetical protein
MAPLPFTYHDVLSKLHDAEITYCQAIHDQSTSPMFSASIERLHGHIVAAAQPHPARPPRSCRPSYPSCNDRPTGTPTHCELCLDHFGFPGHYAPWCPFLHPENTKDREIKQRILQYKVTRAIKQYPVPDKLKQSMRLIPVPPNARILKPIVDN